jgi:hypothetical protein
VGYVEFSVGWNDLVDRPWVAYEVHIHPAIDLPKLPCVRYAKQAGQSKRTSS